MEIGLSLEVDGELGRLTNAITRIEDRLTAFFAGKDYGEGVASIYIGVILMGPGSERLHPVRAFKYQKVYKFTSRITGERTELNDVVSFDVKPNYEGLRSLNAEAAEQYIAAALVDSMDVFLKHQKKFPQFNAPRFIEDFAACLRR